MQNGDLIHLHQSSAAEKPWEELVETSDPEVMRDGSGQGGEIAGFSFIFADFYCVRTRKLQSHIRMVTGSLQHTQ